MSEGPTMSPEDLGIQENPSDSSSDISSNSNGTVQPVSPVSPVSGVSTISTAPESDVQESESNLFRTSSKDTSSASTVREPKKGLWGKFKDKFGGKKPEVPVPPAPVENESPEQNEEPLTTPEETKTEEVTTPPLTEAQKDEILKELAHQGAPFVTSDKMASLSEQDRKEILGKWNRGITEKDEQAHKAAQAELETYDKTFPGLKVDQIPKDDEISPSSPKFLEGKDKTFPGPLESKGQADNKSADEPVEPVPPTPLDEQTKDQIMSIDELNKKFEEGREDILTSYNERYPEKAGKTDENVQAENQTPEESTEPANIPISLKSDEEKLEEASHRGSPAVEPEHSLNESIPEASKTEPVQTTEPKVNEPTVSNKFSVEEELNKPFTLGESQVEPSKEELNKALDGLGIPVDSESSSDVSGQSESLDSVLDKSLPSEESMAEDAKKLEEVKKANEEQALNNKAEDSIDEESLLAEALPLDDKPDTSFDSLFSVVRAEGIKPEKRKLAVKLAGIIKSGAKAWKDNLSFYDFKEKKFTKSKEWVAGAAVGALEAQAFVFLPGPTGVAARAGLNLAMAAGAQYATGKYFEFAKRRAEDQSYTSFRSEADKIGYQEPPFQVYDKIKELRDKMDELDNKHAIARERLKNFFMGVSAGATYSTVSGIALSMAGFSPESIMGGGGATEQVTPIQTPEAPSVVEDLPKGGASAGTPEPIPSGTPVPEISPPATEVPVGGGTTPVETPPVVEPVIPVVPEVPDTSVVETPPVVSQPEAPAQLPTNQAEVDTLFTEAVAGEVGKNLQLVDSTVNKVIASYGINPDIIPDALKDQIRSSIQHALEEQANETMIAAVDVDGDGVGHGEVTVENYAESMEKAKTAFESSIATEEFQKELANKVMEQMATHQAEIAQDFINTIPTSAVTEVPIGGYNIVDILNKNGYPDFSWSTPEAKEILGLHVAANYPELATWWATLHPDIAFPISFVELPKIIELAKSGDQEAITRLVSVLQQLPPSEKLTVINKLQIPELLAKLVK